MDNNDKTLLLGIDIGTTGCKCTLYDTAGVPVASAYEDYPMDHPSPGWVEEDPEAWWQATVRNIRRLLGSGKASPDQVAGIGVSCANSIIPISAEDEVLYPAIMQIDQRAVKEADWIRETIGADQVFAITGNRIAPGTFSLPTMLWLKHNKPELFDKTHKFLVPGGFLVWKLTGEFTIDTSRMATTLLGDITHCTWSETIAQRAGIPLEKLPRICRPSEVVGAVTKGVARLTGLLEGTPVVAGAMDTVTAAMGSGALLPGTGFLTVGTAARLCQTVDDKELLDRHFLNCPNVHPGTWLSIAVTNCAGASMRWFRDVLGETPTAGENGYAALNVLAAQSPAGANGVIFLPYLSGERSPIWDPYARGVYFGLSLSTTKADLVRATMEGVAFSLRHSLAIWREKNAMPATLTLSGGGANSPVWSAIFADVMDHPFYRLDITETETLGSALLAGMGAGLIDDPADVTSDLLTGSELIEPDEANARRYDALFERYRSLYESLKGEFRAMHEAGL